MPGSKGSLGGGAKWQTHWSKR